MLNHPVTGLTNASTWRHEDLLNEAEHERRVAQCSSPLRRARWSTLLVTLRTQWRMREVRHAAYRSLARIGR